MQAATVLHFRACTRHWISGESGGSVWLWKADRVGTSLYGECLWHGVSRRLWAEMLVRATMRLLRAKVCAKSWGSNRSYRTLTLGSWTVQAFEWDNDECNYLAVFGKGVKKRYRWCGVECWQGFKKSSCIVSHSSWGLKSLSKLAGIMEGWRLYTKMWKRGIGVNQYILKQRWHWIYSELIYIDSQGSSFRLLSILVLEPRDLGSSAQL